MYPKYQFYTEKNQKIFSPEGVKCFHKHVDRQCLKQLTLFMNKEFLPETRQFYYFAPSVAELDSLP